ncbi:hypothetical protein B484DRAFT_441057, partial [Ochromonadaceae sp. CCMP2298]
EGATEVDFGTPPALQRGTVHETQQDVKLCNGEPTECAMAVEDAEEERRWETSLQARAEKEDALRKKKKSVRALKHSTRLTKASPKSKVGKGQREIEMLKSRTAEKVQRLRSAGSGKGTPEGDKGTPMDVETETEQLSVAMQGMAMEVVEGQVEVTTADTSKGIGEEVK